MSYLSIKLKAMMANSGKIYLYNLGDERTDLTGGWVTQSLSVNGTKTLTKETDHLKAICTGAGIGKDAIAAWTTNNTIDLTNVTNLEIDWEASGSLAGGYDVPPALQVVTGKTNAYTDYTLQYAISNSETSYTRKKVQLNVSALSGNFYVRVLCFGSNTRTETVKTYSIEAI